MADRLMPHLLRGFIMEDMTVRRFGYSNDRMLAPPCGGVKGRVSALWVDPWSDTPRDQPFSPPTIRDRMSSGELKPVVGNAQGKTLINLLRVGRSVASGRSGEAVECTFKLKTTFGNAIT